MATEKMSPARARDILRLADTFQAHRPPPAVEAAALARRLRISHTRAATLIRLARAVLAAETPGPRQRYRYRCKYCGLELRAWLPHFQKPSGSLLLGLVYPRIFYTDLNRLCCQALDASHHPGRRWSAVPGRRRYGHPTPTQSSGSLF